MDKKFTYDVAFSFTQKDEPLAFSIYQLLKDRLKCFIYSEEQKKLAGTDGEETFNKVFSEESRIVVVFQNSDWANTKWTRIEETAIKNRGFDDGYDFVILIPTEKVAPPKWLPKTRLWVGLERWGIESAASVIEARVHEFGGTVKELTVTEKLAQADALLRQKRANEQFLLTVDGYKMAEAEFENLVCELENLVNEAKAKAKDWHLHLIKNVRRGINLLSYDHCLTIQWHGDYAFITVTDGYFNENLERSDHSYNYTNISADRKTFYLDELNQKGWIDKDTKQNFTSTKKLASDYFEKLFDVVQKHRIEKNR